MIADLVSAYADDGIGETINNGIDWASCELLSQLRNEEFSMPTVSHVEKHFMATDTVRDIVIGMADGLTVPFALAAGLSAAVSNTSVIVTAGMAEIAAGAIAMGLGGYLAARTDAQHFEAELAREGW